MKISKVILAALLLLSSTLPSSAAVGEDDRVAVDLSVQTLKSGSVSVSATKSSLCGSYSLALFTADIATRIGDGSLAQYFANQKAKKYAESAVDAKFLDFGFAVLPETQYTLLALAYDKDGNPGLVTRADFTTLARVPVGLPMVEGKVISVGPDSVSVKFTPNADVAGYALCLFGTGEMDKSLQQHGPLLGFSNVYDMIKRFSGKDYSTERVNTWRDLVPVKAYDVCVLPWDKNGVFQDITIVPVVTQQLGGDGLASVDITIGEFGGNTSTGYYQVVVYSPNDQAALHRDIIITEEAYNKPDMGEKGVIEMLQKEVPNDPYWNQYRVDKAQWSAQPATAYYAFSMAKNAKGEWGKLVKVKFTTPKGN